MSDNSENYQELLEEKNKEIKLLEEKLNKLCILFKEHDKKLDEYINDLKKIQEDILKLIVD